MTPTTPTPPKEPRVSETPTNPPTEPTKPPTPEPEPIRRPLDLDRGNAPAVHGSPWLIDERPGKPADESEAGQ